MTSKPTFPRIHLNGTSKQELYDSFDAAWDALQKAYEALKLCSPNMRDYYVYEHGQQMFDKAVLEHQDRLQMLKDLQAEISEIMDGIDSQGRQ